MPRLHAVVLTKMASKLLLLPLVPALAFGVVEVASRISTPLVVIEQPTPVKRVIKPVPAPEPECRGCTLAY